MDLNEGAGDELLIRLKSFYLATMKADPTIGDHPDEFEYHITYEDEVALSTVSVRTVGKAIATSILLNGARGTFKRLFGINVIWGAKRTELRRKHADSDG